MMPETKIRWVSKEICKFIVTLPKAFGILFLLLLAVLAVVAIVALVIEEKHVGTIIGALIIASAIEKKEK